MSVIDFVTADEAAASIGIGRNGLLKRLKANDVPIRRRAHGTGRVAVLKVDDLPLLLSADERERALRTVEYVREDHAEALNDDGSGFADLVDQLRERDDVVRVLFVATEPEATRSHAEAAAMYARAMNLFESAFWYLPVTGDDVEDARDHLHAFVDQLLDTYSESASA